MNKFKSFITNFFRGRYGNDKLNISLLVLTLALCFFALITGIKVFQFLSYIPLVYMLFRLLSTNRYARQKENQAFINFYTPIEKKVKLFIAKLRDREHIYFKCPSCKSELRIPKNKGKLLVTCPKCHMQIDKKS